MEENVQRVFSIMIAVIVFFLLPMYVAFEKKDDIAYALAVRMTSELTENVKNNGYLSKKIYDEYISKLAITGNTYEIKIEHKAYKYNPVICSYSDATHNTLLQTFEYEIYDSQYLNGNISYNGNTYGNLQLSYNRNEEVFTEEQILDILSIDNSSVYTGMSREAYANVGINDIPLEPNLYSSGFLGAVYTMSKGDDFSIRIKNVNTTTAEIFFNTLTLGMASNPMPRVYVNYGCTIQNEKYKNWVVTNSGYTGNVQEVTIAETGNYLLEVWGASGAGNDPASAVLGSRGGKGGYAKGQKHLTQGTKLYIYVGGKGSGSSGGFNGGGNAGPAGNGGGGATDIRTSGGVWNNAASLASRIIVAGGGGGADDTLPDEVAGGPNDGSGGSGGGSNGSPGYINGTNSPTYFDLNNANPAVIVGCAIGGNQNGAGGLQLGFANPTTIPTDVGGGGGGYYGGSPSLHYNGGGGGGSGNINGVTSGEQQTGINSGNGSYRITFVN